MRIRGVASEVITKIKEAVNHILSGSDLLKKMKFEDVKILTQFQVDVPVLNVKSWVNTQWGYPSKGRKKLNSDGCCKGNPRNGGGGSIRRDDTVRAKLFLLMWITNMIQQIL